MMTVSLNIYMYMKEKYTKNPLEEYNNIKGYKYIYMYMKEKYTKNPLEEYNNIKDYISNTPQTHGGSKTLYLER
jgi:hypothetical protein